MRTLYHLPICPFSRTVRLALAEKALGFEPVIEKPWEERAEFIDLNPAGTVPVLVEASGLIVPDIMPILEYLEEAYPEEKKLYPASPSARVEVRRLCHWVHHKFFAEVTEKLVWEKVLKRHYEKGWADSKILRAGATNLTHHLQYFSWLLTERDWIAGSELSIADLSLAAHLSTIDFVGYVPWDKFPAIKNWYACLKSRPSFRPILLDRFASVSPPAHYADLDF